MTALQQSSPNIIQVHAAGPQRLNSSEHSVRSFTAECICGKLSLRDGDSTPQQPGAMKHLSSRLGTATSGRPPPASLNHDQGLGCSDGKPKTGCRLYGVQRTLAHILEVWGRVCSVLCIHLLMNRTCYTLVLQGPVSLMWILVTRDPVSHHITVT